MYVHMYCIYIHKGSPNVHRYEYSLEVCDNRHLSPVTCIGLRSKSCEFASIKINQIIHIRDAQRVLSTFSFDSNEYNH